MRSRSFTSHSKCGKLGQQNSGLQRVEAAIHSQKRMLMALQRRRA